MARISLFTGLGGSHFFTEGYGFASPGSSVVTEGWGGSPHVILQGYGVATRTDYVQIASGGMVIGDARGWYADYLVLPSGGLTLGGVTTIPSSSIKTASGGMRYGGAIAADFVPATLSVNPGRLPLSKTTTNTFIGVGMAWLSNAPLFTPTGVAGISLGAITVVDDNTATVDVTTSTTPGTITWTESTLGKTVQQAVLNKVPHWFLRRYR